MQETDGNIIREYNDMEALLYFPTKPCQPTPKKKDQLQLVVDKQIRVPEKKVLTHTPKTKDSRVSDIISFPPYDAPIVYEIQTHFMRKIPTVHFHWL